MNIEQQILKKLMYNKGMSYNRLRDEVPSNKFAYYLNKLATEGIIKKTGENYELTPEGIHLVASIDGQDIKEKKKPIVCTFILGYENGKILLNKREKQPFMDYVGVPGGKVEFGSLLPEEAAREFLEETGLTAEKFELKHITNYRTYDKPTGELTHHVIGFFFLATGITGELKDRTREGSNFWTTVEETKKMLMYPDFPSFSTALLEGKEITFAQADRFAEDGHFVGITFLND
ncbi:NUDIX domain-containing protein [Candidatus Woesearchaeota archaeon]|nr:NUDIX domain-containing protein [Candidatus Woesearchaeota archaeon]